MTFDQIIAIANDLAASAAAAAALAAARGTFLVVKQMQRQIIASYQPELTFTRVLITGSAQGESWPIPSSWHEGEQTLAQDTHSDKLVAIEPKLKLFNIGLGAAVNIHIDWDFPIEHFIKQINILAQKALIANYIEFIPPGLINFKSEIWKVNSSSIWGNQKSESTDYILSGNTQKVETSLTLPYAIRELVSSYIYFWFIQKSDNKTRFLNIPSLKAIISYNDIDGVVFDISFNFNFLSLDKEGLLMFTLYLTPKKIK